MATLEEQLAQLTAQQTALGGVDTSAFAPTSAPSTSAFQGQLGSIQPSLLGTFLSPQIGVNQLQAEQEAIANRQAAEGLAGIQAAEAAAEKARMGEVVRREDADAKVEAARLNFERQKELRQMDIAQRAQTAKEKAAVEKGLEKGTKSTVVPDPTELEMKAAKRLTKELTGAETGFLGFGGNITEMATEIAMKAKAIQFQAIRAGEPAPDFTEAFTLAAGEAASTSTTKEEVKAAMQSGQITREQAKQEIQRLGGV